MLNQHDPNVIAARLSAAGNDWADKNAAAKALERAAKAMRYQCFLDADGNNEVRKAKAETAQAYQDLLDKAGDAETAAIKARVRYDTMRTEIDLIRTMESTKRAEMGMR